MPYPTPAAPGHQPFEAVLAQLTMRPGMVEHLEGIDLDGDGVPDMPLGQPSPQMLAHPMGRMQWQALMQDRQHKMRTAHQRRAQRKEINNQVLLAHLQANDPLFTQVHAKVEEFVRTLSPKLQRPFLRTVEETLARISTSIRRCVMWCRFPFAWAGMARANPVLMISDTWPETAMKDRPRRRARLNAPPW